MGIETRLAAENKDFAQADQHFLFYIKIWQRHVFTCAALMLAPQFIVAQICTLGSSTSRITNTKALLLNLYNTGQKL